VFCVAHIVILYVILHDEIVTLCQKICFDTVTVYGGGVTQGVPYTVTITSLLCFPI
jgi:hypothetical protein